MFGRLLLCAHITFPRAIQGTSLRAAIRGKANIAATVTAVRPGQAALACTLVNQSVTGALIESTHGLAQDNKCVTLAFQLIAQPGNYQVDVTTRASVKNMNVVRPAFDQTKVFTYGVQFVDLDPNHYALPPNMMYEALIADRQKIV